MMQYYLGLFAEFRVSLQDVDSLQQVGVRNVLTRIQLTVSCVEQEVPRHEALVPPFRRKASTCNELCAEAHR
jgi:hypothetical protein